MKICIVGWYGTETLGDRAILDGVIYLFESINKGNSYYIGSLYPVLTERTIFEDINLYRSQSDSTSLAVNCFDVKNKKKLEDVINKSDFVIMGGGPLMDLRELFVIEYAFDFAKKMKKKTALIGCGYNSVTKKEYISSLKKILHYSDLIVMRSLMCYKRLINDFDFISKKTFHSCDPAIISVLSYKHRAKHGDAGQYWLANIRDMDYVYGTDDTYYPIIKSMIISITSQVSKLILLPNHTFSIGGDDRYIMNKIRFELNLENLEVCQKPLSLKETYDEIISAQGCVGMRYHAMVFQSFLNGNNYYADYTDKSIGKVRAFLSEYLIDEQLNNRYINLYNGENNLKIHERKFEFPYDERWLKDYSLEYKRLFKSLLNIE